MGSEADRKEERYRREDRSGMANPHALAAAAAVAARINATLAHKHPNPLLAAQAAAAAIAQPKTHFEADVDINHSRIRHVLVKGGTHTQVRFLCD